MLKDVIKITNLIIDTIENTNKKIYSPARLYDFYRSLCQVIRSVNTVANHYLALDFSEDFLQNSS